MYIGRYLLKTTRNNWGAKFQNVLFPKFIKLRLVYMDSYVKIDEESNGVVKMSNWTKTSFVKIHLKLINDLKRTISKGKICLNALFPELYSISHVK